MAAEASAQIANFQELTKCHARVVELEKALKGTNLQPSVDALLGRGKKKAPRAKAGNKKKPNGGKVKKPKAAKATA